MTEEKRRVCLLTGASGRLGIAFCQRYASRYDIVAVTGRRPLPVPTQDKRWADPADAQADLPANQHPVHHVQADLRERAELRRVVEVAVARFGTVDLLVNAAVISPRSAPLVADDPSLDDVFLLNSVVPLRLAALLAEACWLGSPGENRLRNRNVVNLSSMYGTRLGPLDGKLAAYGASKAALNLLSVELAAQLRAHGVRVNVLAPTTFPKLVPTETVADQVVALDQADTSGSIVMLNREEPTVERPGWVMGPGPGPTEPAPAESTVEVDRESLGLAAARPGLRAAERAAENGPSVRIPTAQLPQLNERFGTRGWAHLPGVLDKGLLLQLRREAIGKEAEAVVSKWDGYGLGADGTYFSGAMSFRSASPGPFLSRLHRDPAVLHMVRELTGNPRLVPNDNVAYMYYSDGSFIHAHTDVPECAITLLAGVIGPVPPLVVYPRLRGGDARKQLRAAKAADGMPPGGREVPIPVGGVLALNGRELPHRRPEVPPGSRVVLATLCYSEPKQD
jgi:NAD(P)-dependent dehydrogenase (short-subunit alcohol dehydrogenase family)